MKKRMLSKEALIVGRRSFLFLSENGIGGFARWHGRRLCCAAIGGAMAALDARSVTIQPNAWHQRRRHHE